MEIFLSDRALQGTHPTSRRQGAESKIYFCREDHLTDSLDRARDSGIRKILCTPQPGLLNLLKRDPQRWPFEIYGVVPNFLQFVRDTSHHGTTGTALRRILAMPLGKKISLGFLGLAHCKKALGMKFDLMMNLFLMAEASQFAACKGEEEGLNLKALVMHPQITDLALALGQAEIFALFAEVARKFGAEPGFATQNLGLLAEVLQPLGVSSPWIVSPFNARGYRMNPDSKSCERVASEPGRGKFIADFWDLTAGSDWEGSLLWLKARNFSGAVLDLDETRSPDFAERASLILKSA